MADDAALLAALQLRLQGGAGPLPKLEYVAAALAMARDQIAPVFALANVPRGGSRTRVLQWRDRILREGLVAACTQTTASIPTAPTCSVCGMECQLVVCPYARFCDICGADIAADQLYWACSSTTAEFNWQRSRATPDGELREFWYRDQYCTGHNKVGKCEGGDGVDAIASAVECTTMEWHDHDLCHDCSGDAVVDWNDTHLAVLVVNSDSESDDSESADEQGPPPKPIDYQGVPFLWNPHRRWTCFCPPGSALCRSFAGNGSDDLPCVQRTKARLRDLKLLPDLLVSEAWVQMHCPNIQALELDALVVSADGQHAIRYVSADLVSRGLLPKDAAHIREDVSGYIEYDVVCGATPAAERQRADMHRRREEECFQKFNRGLEHYPIALLVEALDGSGSYFARGPRPKEGYVARRGKAVRSCVLWDPMPWEEGDTRCTLEWCGLCAPKQDQAPMDTS